MRSVVIGATLSILISLSGCVSNQYGNYANASIDANQRMASDSTAQLVVLYPPALTRFHLSHRASDPYGQALVKNLRSKGYAIQEFSPTNVTQQAISVDSTKIPDIELSYVLDTASSNLYRVSLQTGTRSISRAFVTANDGKVYPAGSWVREE